jgi:hypothetical protein
VAAELQPVVFRPRTNATGVIWALSGLGVVLMAALFVFTNLGLQFRPSPPIFIGTLVPVVAIALLNRPRPIGLDRAGLHFGSPDKGYVIPWSDIAGVKALPRNLVVPERIRIALIDRGLGPGYLASRRWGLRVLSAGEVEVPLGYGQTGAEISDRIRQFIDVYG